MKKSIFLLSYLLSISSPIFASKPHTKAGRRAAAAKEAQLKAKVPAAATVGVAAFTISNSGSSHPIMVYKLTGGFSNPVIWVSNFTIACDFYKRNYIIKNCIPQSSTAIFSSPSQKLFCVMEDPNLKYYTDKNPLPLFTNCGWELPTLKSSKINKEKGK